MATKKQSGPASDFLELRKQAEEKIQQEVLEISKLSNEETARLVHELRVHQIELEMQNEELRQTQQELQKTRDEYIDIYDFAPVGYFTLSEKGIVLKANLTLAKLFGVERSILINNPFSQWVAPDAQDTYYFLLNRFLDGKTLQTIELKLKRKDGSEFYCQLEGVIFRQSVEVPPRFRITISDITERKTAELKIKASLKEKEVLLQEIHHRVKNNMNVIVGLLKLQANAIDDEYLKDALKESRNRVQSMSMVHDTLYRSEDLSSINLHTYLTQLVETIVSNSSISGHQVSLCIEVEHITLGVMQANPLGLIVNELVSNSLKHAFPDNDAGQIKLKLNRTGQDQIELIYSDNGIGMPENFDWQNTKSLGLKLIKLLAEDQLNGSLELNQDQETCFTVRFKGDDIGLEAV